jgi:integrase
LWLRAILAVGYNYGWREGEIVPMRVSQIDLADRTIRLEVGTPKNGHGRTVTMTNEVFTLLQACAAGKNADDYLFTRRDASPVRDFRTAWQGACVRSGLGNFICLCLAQMSSLEKSRDCFSPKP